MVRLEKVKEIKIIPMYNAQGSSEPCGIIIVKKLK